MLRQIPFATQRLFYCRIEAQYWLTLRLWGDWCWCVRPSYREFRT